MTSKEEIYIEMKEEEIFYTIVVDQNILMKIKYSFLLDIVKLNH